jgi:glucuronosyltransferase
MRLFISHGGLLSMQEAIYHEVPILITPFASDQHANAAKAAQEGFGMKLEWSRLNEGTLASAIETILSQPRC